jgi:hypothetical protein
LTTAVPAAAQVTIGADAGLLSAYVWRGVSYTNKPVIQPDVWLSAYGVTVGAWANVEPSQYDGANDISEGGGVGSGIREIDLWVDYARTTGNASWKLGWTIYTFDTNDAGYTAIYDTHEFYGQLSLGGLPVTPTVYAAYDIGKVKGLYIQPSLTYGIAASPNLTINIGALAGISAGQELSASDPSYNFAKSGLTHVDLSASTSFAAGPLSIAPAFHVQISNDQATKRNAVNKPDEGLKIWGGVTLSWSRALGATASE